MAKDKKKEAPVVQLIVVETCRCGDSIDEHGSTEYYDSCCALCNCKKYIKE